MQQLSDINHCSQGVLDLCPTPVVWLNEGTEKLLGNVEGKHCAFKIIMLLVQNLCYVMYHT